MSNKKETESKSEEKKQPGNLSKIFDSREYFRPPANLEYIHRLPPDKIDEKRYKYCQFIFTYKHAPYRVYDMEKEGWKIFLMEGQERDDRSNVPKQEDNLRLAPVIVPHKGGHKGLWMYIERDIWEKRQTQNRLDREARDSGTARNYDVGSNTMRISDKLIYDPLKG